jgi:hypothetical protein
MAKGLDFSDQDHVCHGCKGNKTEDVFLRIKAKE